MTKYVHIVQVHPVENGEPNLHKVKFEWEFGTEKEANEAIEAFNWGAKFKGEFKAVYLGRVNDATGELV